MLSFLPKACIIVYHGFKSNEHDSETSFSTILTMSQYTPKKRAPDLTVPDFILWGYLKSKVYAINPKTIDELKCNIRAEIAAITP